MGINGRFFSLCADYNANEYRILGAFLGKKYLANSTSAGYPYASSNKAGTPSGINFDASFSIATSTENTVINTGLQIKIRIL